MYTTSPNLSFTSLSYTPLFVLVFFFHHSLSSFLLLLESYFFIPDNPLRPPSLHFKPSTLTSPLLPFPMTSHFSSALLRFRLSTLTSPLLSQSLHLFSLFQFSHTPPRAFHTHFTSPSSLHSFSSLFHSSPSVLLYIPINSLLPSPLFIQVQPIFQALSPSGLSLSFPSLSPITHITRLIFFIPA